MGKNWAGDLVPQALDKYPTQAPDDMSAAYGQ